MRTRGSALTDTRLSLSHLEHVRAWNEGYVFVDGEQPQVIGGHKHRRQANPRVRRHFDSSL